MPDTGADIARASLREIGVLDPTAAGSAELLGDALSVATDLLGSWQIKRLTINGITISRYSLVAATQEYTIGVGGNFNQNYPNAIVAWSVIPDDTATDPLELPMGRLYTWDQWQAVRIKTQTAPYPVRMYFDRAWAAGLGRCAFHPIPLGNSVDVRLYAAVPAITSLESATTYDLRPGFMRALKLKLAVELADRHGKDVTPRLEARANEAFGDLQRMAIVPVEGASRPEFAIGSNSGRRNFNVLTGGR